MKPNNYRKLLDVDKNAKTVKGNKYGYMTAILYLAPANESGVMNTCISSTEGCRKACLFTAGMAAKFPSIIDGRINKTKFLAEHPEDFMASLRYDIERFKRKAERKNKTLCVRINGTSDLPKISMEMAREFPDVQFYDYTKHAKPWLRVLPNYHITFSHSGFNLPECLEALDNGINVAVVFNTGKNDALPNDWNGFPVVDGDVSDLRFLDPKGSVVGLRAKGKAKHDTSGFVQISNPLV